MPDIHARLSPESDGAVTITSDYGMATGSERSSASRQSWPTIVQPPPPPAGQSARSRDQEIIMSASDLHELLGAPDEARQDALSSNAGSSVSVNDTVVLPPPPDGVSIRQRDDVVIMSATDLTRILTPDGQHGSDSSAYSDTPIVLEAPPDGVMIRQRDQEIIMSASDLPALLGDTPTTTESDVPNLHIGAEGIEHNQQRHMSSDMHLHLHPTDNLSVSSAGSAVSLPDPPPDGQAARDRDAEVVMSVSDLRKIHLTDSTAHLYATEEQSRDSSTIDPDDERLLEETIQ